MPDSSWRWRPLSVADLFDDTFKVFRARFGLFFAVNAVILIPLALLQSAMLPTTSIDIWEWYVGSTVGAAIEQQVPELVTDFSFVGYSFLFGIVSLLAISVLTGATIWLTVQHLHDGRPTIGAALGTGLKHMWRLTGSRLLLGLALIGASIALTLIVVILVLVAGPIFGSILGTIIAVVGIIAGTIAIGVRWLLTGPAVVAEDFNVFAAIGRSFRLSRGAVWSMLGRYLLFVLMVVLMTTVPSIVIGSLVQAALATGSVRLVAAVSGLGSAAINAVFQPLLPIMITLLYFDRRVRTEGYDLQQMAEQLEP